MKKLKINNNKIDIILLLDGMTNQRTISGDYYLDKYLKHRKSKIKTCWKIYNPVSRKGEVETTEVYPYFFGLPNTLNPGRAGFEMVKKGDIQPLFSTFVTVRTKQTSLAMDINKKHNVYTRISDYSSDKGTVLMAAENKSNIEDSLTEMKNTINDLRITHFYNPGPNWYNKVKKEDSPFVVAGYLDGPLKFAMQILGLKILYEEDKYFKFKKGKCQFKFKKADIEDRIFKCLNMKKIPVFYLKLFAQEGRFGGDKKFSAKALSKIICWIMQIMQKYTTDPTILAISDHNSERGIDRTFSGNTKFGIITNSQNQIDKFENSIPNGAIEQCDLIDMLIVEE